MTREEYFKKYAPIVSKVIIGTGLFPSVMLAQGALESGNGNSSLAATYNNHFGIKADSTWKGKVVNLKTREVINSKSVYIIAPFRWYDKPEDSFADRVAFLKRFKRYAKVFTAPTPQKQAEELLLAGYATDPKYSDIIKQIISTHKLESYDGIKKKE